MILSRLKTQIEDFGDGPVWRECSPWASGWVRKGSFLLLLAVPFLWLFLWIGQRWIPGLGFTLEKSLWYAGPIQMLAVALVPFFVRWHRRSTQVLQELKLSGYPDRSLSLQEAAPILLGGVVISLWYPATRLFLWVVGVPAPVEPRWELMVAVSSHVLLASVISACLCMISGIRSLGSGIIGLCASWVCIVHPVGVLMKKLLANWVDPAWTPYELTAVPSLLISIVLVVWFPRSRMVNFFRGVMPEDEAWHLGTLSGRERDFNDTIAFWVFVLFKVFRERQAAIAATAILLIGSILGRWSGGWSGGGSNLPSDVLPGLLTFILFGLIYTSRAVGDLAETYPPATLIALVLFSFCTFTLVHLLQLYPTPYLRIFLLRVLPVSVLLGCLALLFLRFGWLAVLGWLVSALLLHLSPKVGPMRDETVVFLVSTFLASAYCTWDWLRLQREAWRAGGGQEAAGN